MTRKQAALNVIGAEIKKERRAVVEGLERIANDERISIPKRLAIIYRIYELRGIPKYVYSEEET